MTSMGRGNFQHFQNVFLGWGSLCRCSGSPLMRHPNSPPQTKTPGGTPRGHLVLRQYGNISKQSIRHSHMWLKNLELGDFGALPVESVNTWMRTWPYGLVKVGPIKFRNLVLWALWLILSHKEPQSSLCECVEQKCEAVEIDLLICLLVK